MVTIGVLLMFCLLLVRPYISRWPCAFIYSVTCSGNFLNDFAVCCAFDPNFRLTCISCNERFEHMIRVFVHATAKPKLIVTCHIFINMELNKLKRRCLDNKLSSSSLREITNVERNH